MGYAHVQYVCRVSELGQNLGYALPGMSCWYVTWKDQAFYPGQMKFWWVLWCFVHVTWMDRVLYPGRMKFWWVMRCFVHLSWKDLAIYSGRYYFSTRRIKTNERNNTKKNI